MDIVSKLSSYAIPTIFLFILAAGMLKEVKVYDVFVEGAKDGISTVLRIIPPLVGLMVAIGVFRASGALDLIVFAVKPVTTFLKIPSETVPLVFLRPISGSASLALVSDLFKIYGPDSFIGRLASTLMGSTETIFYTLAVYFGSVGIKNIRFTLLAALVADLVSVITAVWICTVVFGG